MNEIAVFTGSLTIYWSAIVICLGIAAGLCLTLALYPMDHRHNTAVNHPRRAVCRSAGQAAPAHSDRW